MGFRFRQSIKIAPGVRINLGARGASVSVGRRGASITAGARGVHANVGLPGTGLSYRERLDKPRSQPRRSQSPQTAIELNSRAEALAHISLSLDDKGVLSIIGGDGLGLSTAEIKMMWEQKADDISGWLKEEMAGINGDTTLLTALHHNIIHPDQHNAYETIPFNGIKPIKPSPEAATPEPLLVPPPPLGFLRKQFQNQRDAHANTINSQQIEHAAALVSWRRAEDQKKLNYQQSITEWEQTHQQWVQDKSEHQAAQANLAQQFSRDLRENMPLMAECLEQRLNALVWPRETQIAYDLGENPDDIGIDVDLPEIAEFPQQIASMAASGKRLTIKNKSQKQLRLEYATHIHGILLKVASVVFSTLPSIQLIILSGYSQRLDNATGHEAEDYLLSFKVTREQFGQLNFKELDKIDPLDTITLFEHRRKMTATGIFKAIEPFEI